MPTPSATAQRSETAARLGNATATRLSVNLSREVADALADIAAKHGISITEAVRRSISTQKYIEDVTGRGATILVKEKNKPLRELVFI